MNDTSPNTGATTVEPTVIDRYLAAKYDHPLPFPRHAPTTIELICRGTTPAHTPHLGAIFFINVTSRRRWAPAGLVGNTATSGRKRHNGKTYEQQVEAENLHYYRSGRRKPEWNVERFDHNGKVWARVTNRFEHARVVFPWVGESANGDAVTVPTSWGPLVVPPTVFEGHENWVLWVECARCGEKLEIGQEKAWNVFDWLALRYAVLGEGDVVVRGSTVERRKAPITGFGPKGTLGDLAANFKVVALRITLADIGHAARRVGQVQTTR